MAFPGHFSSPYQSLLHAILSAAELYEYYDAVLNLSSRLFIFAQRKSFGALCQLIQTDPHYNTGKITFLFPRETTIQMPL